MRLIESRTRKRRHPAGIAASVVLHAGIIVLAVVGTTRAAEHRDVPETTKLVYVAPPDPPPAPPSAGPRGPAGGPPTTAAAPRVPIFDAPALPQLDIPAAGPVVADPTQGIVDALAAGPRLGGDGIGSGGAGTGGAGTGGVLDAMTVDRAVIALPGPTPRYPEPLRAAGVSGRAVARFVVDTMGRVEPAGIAITAATHPLFAEAVRRTLPSLRFRPAEAHGRRVRQLVEMPFEFCLDGACEGRM